MYTDEVTVGWTSNLYDGYENNSFIVAALSMSAAYSFTYNITIIPYEVSNEIISGLSIAALGKCYI